MVTNQGSPLYVLDDKELTAPFDEYQPFSSIWQALQWKHIRVRVPTCCKRLLHSRYMLANVVYLLYSISILFINFHPSFNQTSSHVSFSTEKTLDEPVTTNPIINRCYIGLAILHLISAFFYCWAWQDRSWFDIVMIPEYLNHIEAGLYLWSAFWYSKQDTLGGPYTLAVHKIEMTATLIELVASFGW